jgi:predicted DNA-binding protein
MKTTSKRNNTFSLNLSEEEAQKLKQLAQANDHPTSTQAYIIIRNYLNNINLLDDNGNTIIKI